MELLKDNTDLFKIQSGLPHFYCKMKITKEIKETAPSPFIEDILQDVMPSGTGNSLCLNPLQNHSLCYCHHPTCPKTRALI